MSRAEWEAEADGHDPRKSLIGAETPEGELRASAGSARWKTVDKARWVVVKFMLDGCPASRRCFSVNEALEYARELDGGRVRKVEIIQIERTEREKVVSLPNDQALPRLDSAGGAQPKESND